MCIPSARGGQLTRLAARSHKSSRPRRPRRERRYVVCVLCLAERHSSGLNLLYVCVDLGHGDHIDRRRPLRLLRRRGTANATQYVTAPATSLDHLPSSRMLCCASVTPMLTCPLSSPLRGAQPLLPAHPAQRDAWARATHEPALHDPERTSRLWCHHAHFRRTGRRVRLLSASSPRLTVMMTADGAVLR